MAAVESGPAARAERPLFGAAMIVSGMVVVGFIDNFVRVAAAEIGLWQFQLLRVGFAVPALFLAARLLGARPLPRRWGGALLRTGFAVASMTLYFGALPAAPIAVVAAGLFTSPLWALLFTALLYREPLGPRRLFAAALGFAGVLTMLRPWESGLDLRAAMPIAAGALWAVTLMATRRLAGEETPAALTLLQLLGFAATGIVGLLALAAFPAAAELRESAPFFFTGWLWPLSAEVWGVLILQGFGSVAGLLLIILGYQSADATRTALFDYSFLVFAGFFGWVIWGEALGGAALAGMALIVAAGAFLALSPAARAKQGG